MAVSCLGGFYPTFFLSTPVRSLCHRLCGAQSAPSLLIQSLTRTIKARLCVFVSPIVTIFSLLLFLVGMLCHTLYVPIFFSFFPFILFLIFTSCVFSFYCVVIINRGQHLSFLFSFPVSFCSSLLIYFLPISALFLTYCQSIPPLIHSLTPALPIQPS